MNSASFPPPRASMWSGADKPSHRHALPIRRRHHAQPRRLHLIDQFAKSDAGIRRHRQIGRVDLDAGAVLLRADEQNAVAGRAGQLGDGVGESGDDLGREVVPIGEGDGGEELLLGGREGDVERVTGRAVAPRAVGVEERAAVGVALERGRRSYGGWDGECEGERVKESERLHMDTHFAVCDWRGVAAQKWKKMYHHYNEKRVDQKHRKSLPDCSVNNNKSFTPH